MAFVGKPNVANQSPVWDGSKWVTSFVSSSSGGSTSAGVPMTFDVVTASLTSSYSFPTQPAWSTIVSITSSWTDTMFWAKAAGECAGSNTIWLRLLIDSGSVNASTGTFGNYSTFIETSTNGAGFGGTLNGRITGLSPGVHTFTLQGVKGSAANTPLIIPGGNLGIHGATLTLMNLSSSTSTPTVSTNIGPKVTKIFTNLQGNGVFPSTPVTNWTGSFNATGQPCIFFGTATGFNSSAAAGETILYFKIDGDVVASSSVFFNEVEHGTFPTIMHPATLSSGSHTIRFEITATGGTGIANNSDFINLLAIEFSSSATTAASNQWVDTGNKMSTTSSLAISSGESITNAAQKGNDVWFYVSGTVGSLSGTSNTPKRTLFGGDVITSGSFSTALAPIFGPPPASSSWIPINTSGATILDENGTIFMSKPSAAGPSVSLLMMSSSKVPYKATAQFAFTPTFGSIAGLGGLYLRESSTGRLVGFGYHWDTGPVWRNYLHKLNSPTSANSDYLANNNTFFYPYIWLQVEDDGSNRIHRMSYDGKFFHQIFSVGRTDFLTADMVGWGIDTQGAAARVRLVSWRIE